APIDGKLNFLGNIEESGFINSEENAIVITPERRADVAGSNHYQAQVNLGSKLRTNYKKVIYAKENMTGSAEIITEDRSLLSRVLDKFLYIFRNRRNSRSNYVHGVALATLLIAGYNAFKSDPAKASGGASGGSSSGGNTTWVYGADSIYEVALKELKSKYSPEEINYFYETVFYQDYAGDSSKSNAMIHFGDLKYLSTELGADPLIPFRGIGKIDQLPAISA
uniref:DUF2207 domain-containing protein n=1 Tax=Globodera pallida TaxID=36090 RepID=A0A183CRV7_GLOPA